MPAAISHTILDLWDLQSFFWHNIRHPVQSAQSNLSHLAPCRMVHFKPDQDIPDLSGKVILVTGGE